MNVLFLDYNDGFKSVQFLRIITLLINSQWAAPHALHFTIKKLKDRSPVT